MTEKLSKEELNEINKGLKNVREGKVHSIEYVAKKFGVKLKNSKK
ncbi:MAG: hypothetical protein WC602_06775 [archaeon]